MVKNIIKKSEYEEVTPIFKRKEVQYYLLRINPQEVDNELYSVIEDVYDHNPTKNDRIELYNNWLNMEKRVKINNIISYDISENVNSFKINGMSTNKSFFVTVLLTDYTLNTKALAYVATKNYLVSSLKTLYAYIRVICHVYPYYISIR